MTVWASFYLKDKNFLDLLRWSCKGLQSKESYVTHLTFLILIIVIIIIIIIACKPVWDIVRQSGPSSHHGPGTVIPTLPMCSQSSSSLPPGHGSRCFLVGLSSFSSEGSRRGLAF